MRAGDTYEIAQLSLKPEAVGEFAEGASLALDVVRSAPGCRAAYLLSGIESPERPVIVIRWDDVASHLAFRASESFASYRRPIQDSFAQPPTFQHFVVEKS